MWHLGAPFATRSFPCSVHVMDKMEFQKYGYEWFLQEIVDSHANTKKWAQKDENLDKQAKDAKVAAKARLTTHKEAKQRLVCFVGIL